ncbi:hypothetical protein [Sandarakinorhabdus sp.]|uniref:hypothetical protein n=1 Tax=Sandarakinorhabdus sp. TaxID=1916663 RepID=UPI003340D981
MALKLIVPDLVDRKTSPTIKTTETFAAVAPTESRAAVANMARPSNLPDQQLPVTQNAVSDRLSTASECAVTKPLNIRRLTVHHG